MQPSRCASRKYGLPLEMLERLVRNMINLQVLYLSAAVTVRVHEIVDPIGG